MAFRWSEARWSSEVRVDKRSVGAERIPLRKRGGKTLVCWPTHGPFGTIPRMGQAKGAGNDGDAQAAILRRVRAIPPGFVRTYGDVSPGAPRLAGLVLSQAGAGEVPWHRVVRADGSLAKGVSQRRLLEDEGVPFRGERVVLSRARLDDLDAG